MIDSRYERERIFHDADTDQRWTAVGKFYDTAAASLGTYREMLIARCEGRTILEYGCGEGESAIELADHGAFVNGIDISSRRIEDAKRFAAHRKDVSFDVMNAEQLTFDADTFDLICGTSILHHLNLERALEEIARTLKPGGEAIFLEPLGHNPLINLYRRMTPKFRTPDEHPLRLDELESARRHFGVVETRFFHLTSLSAVVVRRLRIFPVVLRALDRVDRGLFTALPYLRRYGWIAIVSLREPRASAQPSEPVGVGARGDDSGADSEGGWGPVG